MSRRERKKRWKRKKRVEREKAYKILSGVEPGPRLSDVLDASSKVITFTFDGLFSAAP